MAFIRLEDRYGEIECLVFARQYVQYAHLLRLDAALYIEGNLSVREDEPPKLLVSSVQPLLENGRFTPPTDPKPQEAPSVKSVPNAPSAPASAPEKARVPATKLYLRVPDLVSEPYKKAVNLAEIFEGPVRVIFYDVSQSSYVQSSLGIEASPFVLAELRSLLGSENVVPK